MKIYAFGKEDTPVILLLPGTCCHWKGNFLHVIPLLEADFRVLCVSYDGFDETERTEFPTMIDETEKSRTTYKSIAAGISVRPTAVPSAARLWGCWLRGNAFAWTMAF